MSGRNLSSLLTHSAFLQLTGSSTSTSRRMKDFLALLATAVTASANKLEPVDDLGSHRYTLENTTAIQGPCSEIFDRSLVGGVGSTRSIAIENRQDCEDLCRRDNCAGFSWRFKAGVGGPSLCMIMDWISRDYPDNKPDSIENWRCRAQLPSEKGDYPGQDLANVRTASAADCSYACAGTDGCYAYTWSSWNGGVCYMKTNKPSVVVGPYDGSVISGEPWRCQSPQKDVDIPGGDVGSVTRASWPECCGVCRRTSGCKAFSWNNYNGGTCWLKGVVGPSTKSAGVISGVLYQ